MSNRNIIVRQTIKQEDAEYFQQLLDKTEINFHKMKIAEDSTIETFTFYFGNNIEADIKVCSGQNNCFLDPILFENGSEVCLLDPEGDLIGEYVFEYNGVEYIAILEIE